MSVRVTRQYTDQFRADAIAMCKRGARSIVRVAADLGVSHSTLCKWVRRYGMEKKSKQKPGPEAAPAQETLEEKATRLEREVQRLTRKTRGSSRIETY